MHTHCGGDTICFIGMTTFVEGWLFFVFGWLWRYFLFRVIYCTFHLWLWRAMFSRVWSRVHKKRLFSPSFIIIIIFLYVNSDTNNNNKIKLKIFPHKVQQQQQGISVLIPFFSYHKNMMCTSRVSIFMYFFMLPG